MGAKKKEPSQAAGEWAPSVSEGALLAAAKQNTDVSQLITAEKGCPRFVIWSKGRHFTQYSDDFDKNPLNIKYRGEITKIARECELAPGRITVKYGFAGRLILGPKAKSDQFKLPVVLTVTAKSRGKLKEEKLAVPVIIEPNNSTGYFSMVRRITFDVPEGAQLQDFKVFISFDKSLEKVS